MYPAVPRPPRARIGVVLIQCLKCHQVRGLDIPLGELSVDPNRRSVPRGPDRREWESYLHVVPGVCGEYVKAYQVYRNQLWGAIEGHVWAVVYKVIGSVRGFTAADIRGSGVVIVVRSVRKSEFTEKVVIGCGRERTVGALASGIASSYLDQAGGGIALFHWGLCISITPETRKACRCGKTEWSSGSVGFS